MQRIYWHNGMRVSRDMFRRSDEFVAAQIGTTMMLASAGQFGLIPDVHPFRIRLSGGWDSIRVNALTCRAITKDGSLIDIDNESMDIEVKNLPKAGQLLLLVKPDKWNPKGQDIEELDYTFYVTNKERYDELPENSFPVARLIASNNGWMQDEKEFVPPCLFVSSHKKYEDLRKEFLGILEGMEKNAQDVLLKESMTALLISIQQARIETDWKRDILTPLELMANVQKIVAAFYVSDTLDSDKEPAPEKFLEFSHRPYSLENVYKLVKYGVELCETINRRIEEAKDSMNAVPQSSVFNMEEQRYSKPKYDAEV